MTEFVRKSIQSSVFRNTGANNDLRTVSSQGWTGEITAKFTGEFATQTDADKFITEVTDALTRAAQPTTTPFVDRVKTEAEPNSVINTFNLDTTSPTPPDWR